MPSTIDRLIINSPYEEPAQHWKYDRQTRTFSLEPGRRPAGYVRATPDSRSFDDPGIFVPLPLVEQIRPRVKAWRESGYSGATGITQALLKHWQDPEQRDRNRRLFFCQLEAIETLLWLAEAAPAERQGIEVPSDGGPFTRVCSKMATGSGKTITMAMLITWQVLNKATYPQDKRFSKHIFIVAPGLTVRNRLQVLIPAGPGNFYDEFTLIPPGMFDKLRQGKVMIRNWHRLMPEDPNSGPRVVKKGPESDEAFTQRVLEDLSGARNLIVINDEAHHAWRVPPKSPVKGVSRDDIEEATQWIGGLDRIQKTRGILTCFDFTATPFAPTGRVSGEETLFNWIVSDFGLNDAIESGLVKTPRVVVRDDGQLTKKEKARFYHIYMDPDVKDNLNHKAEEHQPLPDLVTNAYYLLGKDWLDTAERWQKTGLKTPPVMITVANRTETAARVEYSFTRKKIRIEELTDPARILHIDSKVLDEAEAQEEAAGTEQGNDTESDTSEADEKPSKKLSKTERAEVLRQTVDTVGQIGKPGEQIQNVISVGMLSEGWDAKTVTHIMGLRAFTSQLLCEQVVGRGLRRTSYDTKPNAEGQLMFDPEYVNIFGVPFTFLPHEGGGEALPQPPDPPVPVFADPNKREYEISWPNIIRIDHEYRPRLTLEPADVRLLELDALKTATLAELAPILEGKPDVTRLTEINLLGLGRKFRTQRIVFEAARDVFEQMQPTWKGTKENLLAQVIGLVERFITSQRIVISPPLFNNDELRRRIVITLNMNRVVQHIWEAIRFKNTLELVPIFDSERPIRSTGDMRPWGTRRPREITKRSHINLCVFDSTWEASEAFYLDRDGSPVRAWAKNDHLGFEIGYTFQGIVRKYRPDYLIRLTNGTMLVLEVKGQDSQESKTKREFLDEWVKAVNGHGGFGRWAWDVSFHPKDVAGILEKHARAQVY
ncbi:MAG TPA: DEAD/DEAH box helicase family protein [Terriglobia bacterium]|nr:DEAD/DEAH box helicase family protein [Terriglobia bacterium]